MLLQAIQGFVKSPVQGLGGVRAHPWAVLPKDDQSPRPALAGEAQRGAAHPPLR